MILGLYYGRSGLIIGNISGDFFNLIVTFYQTKKSDLRLTLNKVLLKEVLLKYKDYPLYSAIPS